MKLAGTITPPMTSPEHPMGGEMHDPVFDLRALGSEADATVA
jgi:hypothetical protein